MAATNRTDGADATRRRSDGDAPDGAGMAHPTVVPTNFEHDDEG